jgi:hypothetical protein
MKNNKTMQAGAGERNFTATAAGAGAEGGVVRRGGVVTMLMDGGEFLSDVCDVLSVGVWSSIQGGQKPNCFWPGPWEIS